MKKSECFRLAQEAVIKNQSITTEAKIEILRVLIQQEDMAKYVEQDKEKNGQTEENNGEL